jgi:TonB family protein
VFATAFCVLILCIVRPASVHAAKAPHKTDAELTKALIGKWELLPSLGLFSRETFLVFNADGTSKAIGISSDRRAPRRLEVDTRWRITNGGLVLERNKPAPSNFQLHDQIVSIENGVVVLRGPKGRSEMHKISHLPDLPPLAKQMTLSAPQPNYPLAARQNRIQGSGIFKLVLVKDGRVDSIQVIKSTKSKLLDDAAEKALRQWRFEPGLLKEISVPVRFTLDGTARHRMAGTVVTQ